MFEYAALAIERTISQRLTPHDAEILASIYKNTNYFSQSIELLNGYSAFNAENNWWFITTEYHHWQVIIDLIRTNHIYSYERNQRYDFFEDDIIPLRDFLGLDIFCHFSDSDLTKLGISSSLIPRLRTLKSIEELNEFANAECDENTVDILLSLNRCGYLSAGAVYIENLHKNMPLNEWRTYLHPSQLRYVRESWIGPFLLTGAAGTGKTLIAMHRALEIANHSSPDTRILMTTYGKTLTAAMRNEFRQICGKNDKLYERVQIEAINDWTENFFKTYEDRDAVILYKEDELKGIWNKLLKQYTLPSSEYDAHFLYHEWLRVIIEERCFTLETWEKAELQDSCKPDISLDDRKQIWPVIVSYIEEMKKTHRYDIYYAMHRCELILNERPELQYEHIIVDECQDLTISALRMIRALAGKVHENDIFLCGDQCQRVYSTRRRNSSSIIDTTGRTAHLTINYRTPQSIHEYAYQLLPENERPTLTSSYGIPSGIPPILRSFDSIESECTFICQEIKKLLKRGKSASNICIAHRKNTPIEKYIEALLSNGIPVFRIEQNTPFDDPNIEGIRVTTLHRLKGLEFDDIFFAGASEEHLNCGIRHQIYQDDINDAILNEQCLHYVALTRARQRAWITCSEPNFSHFIKLEGTL